MRTGLPKILMLGWEFPPIINGGLGVACHDLSGALSDLAQVTMIVPKSSPGFKVKSVNLVGINNVDPNSLKNLYSSTPSELPFELHEVPANLNPYYMHEPLEALERSVSASSSAEKLRAFNIDNLYGGDVIRKVFQFADITADLATGMDFDIIHAHDWMTMVAGIRIKQRTGKPLVMHIHSLEVDRSGPDSKGWVYELERNGMEYADLLLPVSRFTAENIRTHYHIDTRKITVVHNGCTPVNAFSGERNYREKTVLFVGRLTRQKGPEKFLDIAARVLEQYPDVRFVVAGVGEHFRYMLEHSAYRQIGHRFHMTGFLNMEKLHQLFSISDVYCMPSLSEPFGLSAVEAAQFGIPCVISRQSGVAEVLKGALQFDFWDIDRAASCILSLLNDPVLRKKVSDDASRDLENIRWDISARKVMSAYVSRQFI